MSNKELDKNFDKYLWNKYEPLHERLMRKISYLSKVLTNFNNMYQVKKEYYKTIKPFIKEEIAICKEEEKFQNILSIVKLNNEKYNEFEEEMYVEIINNIKDLIDKMKKEKTYYDDYLKSLSVYKEEKRKMEKLKNIYHANAQIAEKATIYLKELIIKKKLNNDPLINQQIEISENESKNRLQIMSKDCSSYVNSLENVNALRLKLNMKQTKLLKRYEDLERCDKTLYSKIMEIIHKYQAKILNYTGQADSMVEGIQKNIDIDRDIRLLVESLRSREKPEKEIPYMHYPTEIDFDKCSDTKDYKVTNEVVKMMKAYTDKIFLGYDEKLEDKKNRMRELIVKFFDMNRFTDMDDKKQLLEYIKDEKTHELFLIVLSKLRTNNRFARDKSLIELLSEILLTILDTAQKHQDYTAAKNCVILSQTFYYLDESKENKKVYILEFIKKHPWLQSLDFWKEFMLLMILKEFKKLEEMSADPKINIAKNKNVPENVKHKIGEVLFSQLLPYVNNMSEFNVDKKLILKIIDDINDKYSYMGKETVEAIYDIICGSKEELQKVKEEIKNDENLQKTSLDDAVIKRLMKKIRNEGDDEYDDDFDDDDYEGDDFEILNE